MEITPFTSELFDKLPEKYKAWHLQNYGTKEAFLEKAFGFYAVENGEVCCESEESVRLAKRLGFVNPVEYEFLYFPTRN